MRKFFTAVVLIPLGLIFVVFAVANRHLVTVSFDPFNSTDPSIAITLPLFVVIIAVAILGVVAGGIATWFRQRHWRRAARQHEADARQRGRNWPICAPAPRPRGTIRSAFRPRRRAASMGPAGETSRARRCRTRPDRASAFPACLPQL